MATLRPPTGVLYTGATGKLGDQEFRVLGRVRYGYAQGLWDEWFLALEDGDSVWVSEDEDDLTLESYVQLETASFDYNHLDPGDRLRLGGKGFTVTEKDIATCEGGEGQLPFMIVPGERIPFLDLTGDDGFGTVEFDEDGIKVFVGKRISPESVQLDRTRQEAGIGSDTLATGGIPGAGGRERIIKGQGKALSIKCTSCGSPQEVPDEGATTHECAYCGSEINLTHRQVDCPQCQNLIEVKTVDAALSVVCPKCQCQLDITQDSPSILASLAGRKRPPTPLSLVKR
jgi:ribosomal protein S27E